MNEFEKMIQGIVNLCSNHGLCTGCPAYADGECILTKYAPCDWGHAYEKTKTRATKELTAKELHDFCASHPENCTGCPFLSSDGDCDLQVAPCDWDVNKRISY